MPDVRTRYPVNSPVCRKAAVSTPFLLARCWALLYCTFLVARPVPGQPLSDYRNGSILPFSQQGGFYPEFQDQEGYLWGKDEQGRAARFDGYGLESFQAKPFDSTGLQCDGKTYLTEDSKGNIWFAVGSCGLDRYDPQTGRFERLHDAFHEAREVPAQFYYGIYEDSRQDIWIKAQRQLHKYTPVTREFTKMVGMWHLTGLFEDGEQQVWAIDPFIKRKLYKVFPTDGDTLEHVGFPYIGDPATINDFPVVPIIVSTGPDVHLIVFGGHLYRFDSRQRAARPLTEGLQDGELVYTVFNDGITLVGTNRHRVLEYDDRSGTFRPFLELPKLPQEAGRVEKIFRSRDGLLWVVTSLKTFRVLPRELLFRKQALPEHAWPHAPGGNSERLVSFRGDVYFHTQYGLQPVHPDAAKPIRPLLKEEDFRLPPWQAGGKGIAPEKAKQVSGYKFVEPPDGSGLWLVVYHYPFGTTVLKFDTTGKRVYDYFCRGRDACFNDHMQEVDMAADGRIWIAGWAGLSCFNPEDQTFTNFRVKEGLPERTAIAVHCTRDSNVWVGFHSGGLVRYDPAADCFDYYTYDEEEPGSLSSDHGVRDLLEDRYGNLWVATSSGLNRYDPQSNTFEFFSEKDGLPAREIYRLMEDQDGQLWVSTQRHLSCYQREQGVFYSYGKADGLSEGRFSGKKALRDEEGQLYFYFGNGLVYFHPDSVVDARVPELRLRSLQLANQPVKPGDATGVLKRPVGFTRHITLQPWQNVFSLRYAALEYIAPEEIKYAFQLEGFDSDWRPAGNLREATYTNLSPGDYRFKVKCWNRHGLEGEPVFLNITILPPWYRTAWAFLLWALLLTGLLYAVYRFQLNRERLRAQLAYEQREAERLAALDRMKSNFFSNITHEFRTPLSVILGMVNQINRDPQGWLGEGLSKIRQYSFQLLRLVNQMLDLSKLESEKLPVNQVHGDIMPFLRYLIKSFGSYAEANGIDLQLQAGPAQLPMDYDPEKTTAIVSNLLSNAVKFTPAGGRIEVKIQEADDHLQIEVADTGQGIAEGQLPHIFDRFYQADDSTTRAKEGTGIGLAICRKIVEHHGGTIDVSSDGLGRGTTFRVTWPLAAETDGA